jgi:hypothetical protein
MEARSPRERRRVIDRSDPQVSESIHHVLASRALVRARFRQWDAALVDADEVLLLCSYIY